MTHQLPGNLLGIDFFEKRAVILLFQLIYRLKFQSPGQSHLKGVRKNESAKQVTPDLR